MISYWDSSALVKAVFNHDLRRRLKQEKGLSRTHSLAEMFSAFTSGKLLIKMDADDAAKLVANIAEDLNFVELTPADVLNALSTARARGVRGGRVHDYLHALAAKKAGVSGVSMLLTADQHDFNGLVDDLQINRL